MAKAIVDKPKKKKVAKAKPIDDALRELETQTESRYRLAKEIYESQDSETKEVIDRIWDRLRIASTGVVQIYGRPVKLEQKFIDFNIWFLAVEILSDLALMGIKVANFKFSPAICAECKSEILGVPRPKKKGRR